MTVIYDPSVHRSVFFTLHGSVWPDVIGWCILNCCITYVVWTLKHNYDYDITFASTGHDLLSLLISFLVVSHVSTAYGRFWEARAYLGTIFSACRKLSQKVAIYTMDSVDKEAAKQYRQSIETWLLELMHTAMNVIEDEKQALFFAEGTCIESISGTIMMPTTTTTHTSSTTTDTNIDEQQSLDETKKILNKRLLGNVQSFRYQQDPMEVAGMLQAAIMSHEQVLKSQKLIRFELELLGCVNTFIDNYLQLLKFVTTPIPFPLVQMGRTTLFIWIFTLSGVLVHNVYDLLPNLVVIFFITYGFVGLMYVSIELHDPFGKDPNDFEIGRYTNVTALGIKEDLSEEGTRRFQRAAESHKHHHHHRHGSTIHSHTHENKEEEEPSLIKLDDDNNNNMSDDALTQIHGNSTSGGGGRKRKGCSTDSGEDSDNSSDSLIARTTYKSIAPYIASLNNGEHYGGTPNSTGGRRSAAATARRATHRKALSDAFATVSSFSLRGVLGGGGGGNHASASLNKPTGRKQRSSSYGYGSSASTSDDNFGSSTASARRLETANWGALDENDEEGNTNDNTNIRTSLLP